jgi:hypothetical protein
MTLNLLNLDARTRQLMTSEIEHDVQNGTIYLSPRLNDPNGADYLQLLLEAAGAYEDGWLSQRLNAKGCLKALEPRTTRGRTTMVKVPYTAAETLAEGEFNRFYLRAIAIRAQQDGVQDLIIYRAKDVATPRWESEAKLGTSVGAAGLLADLRAHPGVDTALGLPPGPNSGLSAKLP